MGKKQKTQENFTPELPSGAIPCNPSLLAPNNSYGTAYTLRGYYIDTPFSCIDCGKNEIWTAGQQKWWYGTAKGEVNTSAIRCRECRRKERNRKEEARREHLEGLANKKSMGQSNK